MDYSEMNVITWNCRDAANSQFSQAFNQVRRWRNPDVVTLYEPKTSREKAGKVIRKLRFDRSHKVANGFSGGLWVMWKKYSLGGDHH